MRVTTFSAPESAILPYDFKAVPMTTELKVDARKVSAEVYKEKGGQKKEMENWAVVTALSKVSADILIEPRYEYTYEGTLRGGKLVAVKVTGYPATFTNFRQMTKEDVETINLLKSPVKETTVIIKENRQ